MRRRVLVGTAGTRLHVEIAESRRDRTRGLLGRSRLPSGCGLLIPNARSVHTIGMRFPIEVAFLDRDLRVIEVRRLRAGRIARPRLHVRHVLECNPGESPLRGERLTIIRSETAGRSPIYSSLPPGR